MNFTSILLELQYCENIYIYIYIYTKPGQPYWFIHVVCMCLVTSGGESREQL